MTDAFPVGGESAVKLKTFSKIPVSEPKAKLPVEKPASSSGCFGAFYLMSTFKTGKGNISVPKKQESGLISARLHVFCPVPGMYQFPLSTIYQVQYFMCE